MNFTYQIIPCNTESYLNIIAAKNRIETEQHAIDLMCLCAENNTNNLCIPSQALSDQFFLLSSGSAGGILQKFVNYHIRTAIVLETGMELPIRFQEMMLEANKSNEFHFFYSKNEAEQWLMCTQEVLSHG